MVLALMNSPITFLSHTKSKSSPEMACQRHCFPNSTSHTKLFPDMACRRHDLTNSVNGLPITSHLGIGCACCYFLILEFIILYDCSKKIEFFYCKSLVWNETIILKKISWHLNNTEQKK